MRKLTIFICSLFYLLSFSQTTVHIADPQTWTNKQLSEYTGQTVCFDVPFYVCNNYQQTAYVISPRRTFTPTNQALPGSEQYSQLINLNRQGEITISGIDGYHRMGEKLLNLTVQVNSASSVSLVSCDFYGNTREEISKGFPTVDLAGEHTLLVCGFNLEYYLTENFGTGFGADDAVEHERQKTKVADALRHIGADIFGFVEIEQGQAALKELAQLLTQTTGKSYSYIDDGGYASGSYTKSGYVYCTETVEPVGYMLNNNTGVTKRKKMQGFREKATGEVFVYSINHFKAKSGSGSGINADQGDGQGQFNGTRVEEAKSVIRQAESAASVYDDKDLLIMGDLNAYAKEDPITTFLEAGMIDLHRYFHADTAYSYVYHGQAGYLDHAICNRSLAKQITGVQAYHINSDEHDRYTYDKSDDLTMFRCSDHDPVIVGLRLGAEFDVALPPEQDERSPYERCDAVFADRQLLILNDNGGYYRIYNSLGALITSGNITDDNFLAAQNLQQGVYIINVYVDHKVKKFKFAVY